MVFLSLFLLTLRLIRHYSNVLNEVRAILFRDILSLKRLVLRGSVFYLKAGYKNYSFKIFLIRGEITVKVSYTIVSEISAIC